MLNAFSLDDRRIEAARRAIEIEFQTEECNTSVSIAEARMKEDSDLESIRRMCCCIPFGVTYSTTRATKRTEFLLVS